MDLQRFKEVQRQVWSEGDYRPIGRLLEPAARILVDAAGATAGQRVLDVATGSGSVALLAAEAGAEVVGVDITDAWFDEARGRADAAGEPKGAPSCSVVRGEGSRSTGRAITADCFI